jgi:hypothetical protein
MSAPGKRGYPATGFIVGAHTFVNCFAALPAMTGV